jgi:type IV pilus assembly protein PilY1
MGDKQRMPYIEESKKNLVIALSVCAIFAAQTAAAAIGGAGSLSNAPLEVSPNSGPASVVYILDDSGSMHSDWVGRVDYYPWSYARHDRNALYYNPNIKYSPWPWPGRPGVATLQEQTLDRIPLTQTQITAAPRWPIIPEELRTCQTTELNPLRNEIYEMYDSSGVSADRKTRDLTAQVTDYGTYFPAAANIDLPATHYFVYKDVNQDGSGDGYGGGKIDDGELWLVVLLYNNGAPKRLYYEVTDLDHNGIIGDGELILRDEAAVPDWVKPIWANEGSKQPTAEEELESFLQWYVYYSTRNFAAINALATSLQQLPSANVGIYSINTSTYNTIYSAIGSIQTNSSPKLRVGLMPVNGQGGTDDNSKYLLCRLYNFYSADGGTPFVEAYDEVGRYFDASKPDSFVTAAGDRGAAKPDAGGVCQKSYIVNFTDGEFASYYGGNAVGDLDEDSRADTIADFAQYYYDNQHLMTYSVAFGATGTIPSSVYDAYISSKDYYFQTIPEPNWSSFASTVDQLWHASVIGKGIFYSVTDTQDLADAFKSIAVDIGSRQAVGASAAVNNAGQLDDNAILYVGRYSTADWTGQLFAYPVSKVSGEVDTANAVWEAAAKLNNRVATGNNRLIFTSNGNGKALEFTPASLLSSADFSDAQRQMLGDTASDHTAFSNYIKYIRGDNIANLRARVSVLGDIIHSSPVLLRAAAMGNSDPTIGTIYVGANDGMLHAFDVKTGEERFAFIPSQVHDHLLALGIPAYLNRHRYYVDATPVAGRMTFFTDDDGDGIADQPVNKTGDIRLLVSGLGRGGRGYFALDVAGADTIGANTPIIPTVTSMLKWEYPTRQMIGTPPVNVKDPGLTLSNNGPCTYQASGQNNPDNDGGVLCADATPGTQVPAYRDDDLGYSYSDPVIFPTNNRPHGLALPLPTSVSEHPWVVVFGNGYGSKNGEAILYVLDALTGKLIKKIGTGSRPTPDNPLQNGLSSPAALDVNGDDRVDLVYAGDLYGNLWKFDFRSSNPDEWRVAYKDSAGQARPLFTTMQAGQPGQPIKLGQPITSRPDIVAHNKKKGYIIVFGTGQFLGTDDLADTATQSMFGIWDSDTDLTASNPAQYLGYWNRSVNSFPDAAATLPNASLLKQEVIYQGLPSGAQCGDSGCPTVRVVSNNQPAWYSSSDSVNFSNVGWYLDLPGLAPISLGAQPVSSTVPSERVVDDVRIRYGNVLAVSFIPGEEVCSASGHSALMEVSAFTGGGPQKALLNLGSGTLGVDDYFTFSDVSGQTVTAPASGLVSAGKATPPAIIPGANPDAESKVQGNSNGTMKITLEARTSPMFFWREATQN